VWGVWVVWVVWGCEWCGGCGVCGVCGVSGVCGVCGLCGVCGVCIMCGKCGKCGGVGGVGCVRVCGKCGRCGGVGGVGVWVTPYVRHSTDCTCYDFGHLRFLLYFGVYLTDRRAYLQTMVREKNSVLTILIVGSLLPMGGVLCANFF
jgi:hypothetical protein